MLDYSNETLIKVYGPYTQEPFMCNKCNEKPNTTEYSDHHLVEGGSYSDVFDLARGTAKKIKFRCIRGTFWIDDIANENIRLMRGENHPPKIFDMEKGEFPHHNQVIFFWNVENPMLGTFVDKGGIKRLTYPHSGLDFRYWMQIPECPKKK